MVTHRTVRTRDLLAKRSKGARKILRHAISKIIETIPSENRGYGRWFLKEIQEIPDGVVIWCCEQYLANPYVYQGKGFAFLNKMCQNHLKNKDKIAKYEKMMLGSTPPKREVPL